MTKTLTARLNHPLSIGGKPVANRLWLAPMAGLGHVAYREVLDDFGGCGLMFTEMCSARAVPTENRKVSPVFSWRKAELPRLVCQIAGATPDELIPAARRVEDEGFSASTSTWAAPCPVSSTKSGRGTAQGTTGRIGRSGSRT